MHHVRRALVVATTTALVAGIALGGTGTALAATSSPNADPSATPSTAAPSLAHQDATTDHVMGATVPDATPAASTVTAPTGLPGFDVSSAQGETPDFTGAYADGARFVFVKATEGTPGTAASGNATGSVADYRVRQVADAKSAGLLVGTYHYALPYYSSGATQARFYLANTPTGTTLPPVVDLESPSVANQPKEGGACWGLNQSDMVSWIQSYIGTIVAAEGVQPIVYTNNDFWSTCTGNSSAFPKDRLFIAWYPTSTTNTPLRPSGFSDWSFWQWSPNADGTATFPGDQDVFNGTLAQLQALGTSPTTAVGRIAGGSAYETAANIAASAFTPPVTAATGNVTAPGRIDTVYVATRASYPDALSAAAAAGHEGAPVLLTDPNTLPTGTAAELAQLRPSSIELVGGPSAVSASVATALGTYGTVNRVFGNSRYETSAALASVFAPYSASAYPNGLTAYVATGTNFPDALAGAAVAAGSNAPGPMLLVQPDAVPQAIIDQLTRLHPTRIVVLGGTAAVSDAVSQQLTSYAAGGNIDRWSGQDRFETSVVVAQQAFGSGASTAFVATGTNFPDALAGGPAAGVFGAPMLLVRPDLVPDDVRSEIATLGAKGVVVLGGPAAVNAAVEASF
jgi:putative cell wall-binding protein/GH25 family lysozyme M1 (1,4-beta-N-acetylmuramidase)